MNLIYKTSDLTPHERFIPPKIVNVGSTPELSFMCIAKKYHFHCECQTIVKKIKIKKKTAKSCFFHLIRILFNNCNKCRY